MRHNEVISRLKEIEPEIRARGAQALYLFGSHVRDEAGADSDVDIFIDKDRSRPFGFDEFMDIYVLLCECLGIKRAVDHALLIITEAAKHLPQSMKDSRPEVPWHKINGLGNLLRHDRLSFQTAIVTAALAVEKTSAAATFFPRKDYRPVTAITASLIFAMA